MNAESCITFDNIIMKLADNISEEFETTRYSRTSVARTLMARLPRLFRTRS